jgi:energy-coupling factor transporter ATP-binding protein EcfA2
MNEIWPYSGARWWKFDFHTHTPASKDTEAWQSALGTADEVTPDKWLLRYMEAGIDCVAITDHNSGAWIGRLKDAYAALQANQPVGFRELHLFPGVEISVSGGLHLLAIFDKDKTSDTITHLLGAVGFPEHLQGETNSSNESASTRESLIKVVEEIHRRGGIAIPAHADSEKGLLRLKGAGNGAEYPDEIKSVLRSGLLALEVMDCNTPKPAVYADSAVGWSEVLGSDCHNFCGDNPPGSRYTWVKMAQPSLEGLRLALLDGEGFSIRRSDDPQSFDPFTLPEHFIKSIEISEARYMGRGKPAVLNFSPWFNALVGGRGTGKSTVVHAARLVYRRERELETPSTSGEKTEPQRTFQNFNRATSGRNGEGGLLAETAITLTVLRDGIAHRVHWRQDGAGVTVEDDVDGQWQVSPSQIVTPERFPVRIYSQGQIATLAGESQEALLAVIDDAAETRQCKSKLEEVRQRFMALKAQARELDGRLKGRDPLKVQLDDVRRKIARFEEAHHADVLKAYQTRSRQEREITRQIDAAAEMAVRVQQLADELVPDDLPQDLFDLTNEQDREAVATVERLAKAVLEARNILGETAVRIQSVAHGEKDALSKSTWTSAVTKAKGDYAALVEALKAQGVADPSEYGKLVQERQRLETETARLDSLQKQHSQLLEQAQALQAQVLAARRALSEKRQAFLQQTLAQNNYVHIELAPYGRDARAIERDLREMLEVTDGRFAGDILVMENDLPAKGLIEEQLRDLAADVVLATLESETRIATIKQRLESACLGQGNFGVPFGKFLSGQYEKRPEFLDRLLTWFPEDALRVEYSPKGDGKGFRSIGQASPGQRAAAMLAFLLAHGAEPIILDQPEDDLDNHLIYDLVVRQIRANKLRRQIIVVTHNPNIVVNGDAEMLHALDSSGQCFVKQAGSLQDKAMRDEVCNVMEGGHEAFERRYRRLGQET